MKGKSQPLRVIKNEAEYDKMLERADEVFDAKANTAEGNELEVILLLIKDYEDKHHGIVAPDPIEVLKLKMQETGMKANDLVPLIGSKGYVSQLLNKKKPLTAEIMRVLYNQLGIPAEILLAS